MVSQVGFKRALRIMEEINQDKKDILTLKELKNYIHKFAGIHTITEHVYLDFFKKQEWLIESNFKFKVNWDKIKKDIKEYKDVS